MKKIKFIILMVFIVGAFVAVRAMGLGEYLDQEKLRDWISGFGLWGPVVYILIYCVAPSLMLPGLPITVVGGVLFGPFWGVVYVAAGATIGAAIAFLIARYMGRDWVEGVVKGGRIKEIDEQVKTRGWRIVAFTRLIPLFPYNFLNYAFGLTSIKFSHYIVATFIFMIPGIIAYVVFSSSILELFRGRVSKTFLAGVALVIVVSLLPFLYRKLKGGGGGGGGGRARPDSP
ncbi:MAG TPA: TVP38/TMEM64 family protein [Thermodesulfobacteriota bacterium]|nr:TVP38/TMEM64 family protein [Thermodesulfobacteriota bacterium]